MNIERILKEKHITKVQLAERMGVKQQNINGMFKNPTLQTLDKIANAIGIETWQLWSEEIKNGNDNIVICPTCGTRLKVTRDDK